MKKRLAMVIAACMTMTGCNVMGGNVEGLLHPPRLSEEQTNIHNALVSQAGKNIQLKYPKSGDYRSSIIIENIDGEDTKEAIVFYERSGAETENIGLRMNILDQRDGQWTSVFDHSGAGTDVDMVMISSMSENGLPVIAVGYSRMNQPEKTMRVYRYDEGKLNVLFESQYAMMESADLDGDGQNELILISGTSPSRKASASLLKLDGDKILVKSEITMDEEISDYAALTFGRLSDGIPAVFADGIRNDGTLNTQILYTVDGQLKNPLERARELLFQTIRPNGYLCRDIDSDGVVEIPAVTPFPGYESAEAQERVNITEWYSFEQFTFDLKSSGYYNMSESYCFMIPKRWKGTVTVKPDIASDEMVFYKYKGSLSDDMTELLRISVMLKGTNGEKLQNGYETVFSDGQYEYMVKYPKYSSEALVLTKSEIMHNFIVW